MQYPTTLISSLLTTALSSLNLPTDSIPIEQPSQRSFADYSSSLALSLFAKKQAPDYSSARDLAQAIAQACLQQDNPAIAGVTVAGPGFINIHCSDSYLLELTRLQAESQSLVLEPTGKGKTAIVEFSSPNIAKPFTIGHLRSTIIGSAVANILQAVGWTVYKDNHLGDWGTQFGKLIVAIKRWGDITTIEADPRPVKQLVQLYVRFHEEAEKDPSLEDEARAWFTKLEQGDTEARSLWEQCISWSWKEFEAIYQELGITFSDIFDHGRGLGESFFEDKMAAVVTELEASGYLQAGEQGAKLFFFPDDRYPPLMILKKDGSTLYATRDLATDKYRLSQFGNDITIINEVGAEQSLYFRQLFAIETLLGWVKPEQRVHVKHGLYRFHEGKMSTRKGNVIWLEDVIAQAKERALALATPPISQKDDASSASPVRSTLTDEMRENASRIGIGALKWNDLKKSSTLDVVFSWDEMLTMQGNAGPYIQYTAVRAQSILQKAGYQPSPHHLNQTLDQDERTVAQSLLYVHDALQKAAREYAPHHLCTYLYQLSQDFNSFYASNRIIGSGDEEQKRLLLTAAVAQVLTSGLATLGISIPSSM